MDDKERKRYEESLGPFGLLEVCDVCGKPLLKGQKLGKRTLNDALCHDACLYYKKSKPATELSLK
ncbi:MAG: hypothetical protein CEN92_181 [Candidatus Berkelbacteria bacterium Licking1014_96]|uniref:Uncharacterized protein n=1 Tax=Candidatus Berkelbacteria bacterium Licking1014_96 TaxID=2017149 RepID=A0A554LG77_9BACT|nr:MAG: hypothetical protein CEN92_181 [Candidatus Berkelbacteria bacterium Licking1014_96]